MFRETIITKRSILDVVAVLDPPLITYFCLFNVKPVVSIFTHVYFINPLNYVFTLLQR